jgi:quercetin dioxygenase-like cupin family protein
MGFQIHSYVAIATVFLTATSLSQQLSLVVRNAPTSVRPYVLPHLVGTVTAADNAAFRFPITALSSGNAFTLLTTNTGRSEGPNVFPHSHKVGYENFFCEKGALQLWLATNNTSQETRVLEPGDFGASPPGKIHTFQTLRPDTEMFGVVFPGGLE